MRIIKRIGALAVLGTVVFGSDAAPASEFDDAMGPILVEYLKIQQALAVDSTDGVHHSASAIAKQAASLDSDAATGGQAEHYRAIPADIRAACAKLHAAGDLASTREAFKALSRPVSMWVSMAKPVGKSVMHCPMVKAGWVQDGSEVANPYLGEKMASCGQRVGGSEE